MATIEDFDKLDIRCGKIVKVSDLMSAMLKHGKDQMAGVWEFENLAKNEQEPAR